VLELAHVWLTWTERVTPSESDAVLCVPRPWLTQLRMGDRLKLEDLRGKRRTLTITEVTSEGCWADGQQSAYVGRDISLRIARRASGARAAWPDCLAQPCGTDRPSLVVHRGHRLVLAPPDAVAHAPNGTSVLPRIPCSLPSPPTGVCPGAPIWFDDGKVGGRVRRVENDDVEVEITLARQAGSRLLADRSINLPESAVERPTLLPKDLQDLDFVAGCADIVGLSFAESAQGILELSQALRERTSRMIRIVLKIETQVGFEHLPQLLLAAMRHFPVGVMIARGDLAVECGYERMAEVQEEMLWMCEAAHLPVIWATQVLDQLARSGQPSRAEITDAAMAERAECVMLNKGPHILEAVRTLSDIATRMQAHQRKKRSLLRKLRVSAW
jgi:pyruvate kinase